VCGKPCARRPLGSNQWRFNGLAAEGLPHVIDA
jgi:hypothetical protein